MVDQSQGLSPLLPAAELEPTTKPWRSTFSYLNEAVALYADGHSVSAIARKLGIAWASVARLLNRVGVRSREDKRG